VRSAWAVTPQELRDRTKKYAVETARFAERLFGQASTRHAASQLSRAAASAAANYRAACVARSHAEFTAKIGLVLEECDESVYWLEFLAECGSFGEEIGRLTSEGRELTKILGASKRTSRARSRPTRPRKRK
jgi:four helix bundle protein